MDVPPAGARRWVPHPIASEEHYVVVEGDPADVLRTAVSSPVAPDNIVRLLFLLRGLGVPRASIYEFWLSYGFIIVEQDSTQVVFGFASEILNRRAPAVSASEYADWTNSGIKIAADIRVISIENGRRTLLITATKVCAYDDRSRRIFKAYWFVVGPFSAIIRRRWLRCIRRRCGLAKR